MDLDLDDFKQVLLDLYLARREIGHLRQVNAELQKQASAQTVSDAGPPGNPL